MASAATIIAIVSAVISVGSALYAANQQQDETGGQAITKQGSQNPRNRVYGTAVVGTTRVYSNVLNRDQSFRTDVLAVAGIGPLTFHNVWIDEKRMFETDQNILTSPTSPTHGTYDDAQMRPSYRESREFKAQFRSGHETQVAAALAMSGSDGEWTSMHKGALVPHLVIYADFTTDQDFVIFSDKFECKARVTGPPVFDPRTNVLNGDSSNPALAILDYLTSTYYGLSIPMDYIDTASVMHAANQCEFYNLEINSAIDGDAPFSDVLEDMLACFGGSLSIVKGRIKILFEDTESVNLYDFDDSNILAGSFKVSPASSGEYANVITTTFKSGINLGKKDDYVIPADIINDPRILQDGYTKSKTINMPYTIDATEANNGVVSGAVKFITSREYKRGLFQTTCSFDVDLLEYPDLEIWSVVSVSHSIYDFTNKRFRVLSMSTSTDSDSLNIATLHLVEYDDSVYLTDIEGSVVGSTLPIRSDVVSPPSTVAFSLESYVSGGYGTLSWAAGSFTGTTAYDIEYRLTNATDTSWTRKTSQYRGYKYQFYSLKAEQYDFRIRTNDRILGTSVWVETNAVAITVPYTLPQVTGITIDSTTNDFVIRWDDMSGNVITNGTGADDPEAAGTTSTVADVFSNYEVTILVGGQSQVVLTTSELSIPYSYELNTNSTVGLSRTITASIVVVDRSGNESIATTGTATNLQQDGPSGLTVTNSNGNSVIEWDPVSSRDFAGSEIHVGTASDFTPDGTTRVATLGAESFYLYNYTLPNVTDRYVKVAHFDTFSKTSLTYSASTLMSYVSPSIPVYYYIKPLTGTAIINGSGSIQLEAHKVTGGSDEIITSGTIELFAGATANGYSQTYTTSDITNSLIVTLKDGTSGSVLDSISLIDVADGGHAIYGSVNASGPLTWVQTPDTALNTSGAWSPTVTASNLVATFYSNGSAVKTKTINFTRAANGNITAGTISGDAEVTYNVSGTGTPAISAEFTYAGVTVTENLTSVLGAKYGATGITGNGSKVEFSLNGTTLWHATPATGDAYMRTCSNVNGGAWTCNGATLVKGETGDTGIGSKVEFSINGTSLWHATPATGDAYMRTCSNVNGGAWTCNGATLVKGETGKTGNGLKTEFSITGSTLWHDAPATGDKYLRTCTNVDGGAWTCNGSTLIKGETGLTGNGSKVEFSINGTSLWHDAPATGDRFLRTCTNVNGGVWSCSGGTEIKGETGVKGAKHYYIAGSVWSDTAASNYILYSQSDELVRWDIVTISSSGDKFSKTKYWDGNSWEDVAEVIDGNLIVQGTVRADAIDVDDVFTKDITATGTITGATLIGGKLEVSNATSARKVTIDSAANSPLVINDGTSDVLSFDANNKLQLSGGLADNTIDNLSMFSPSIWSQIKAPISEGATGGSFTAATASGVSPITAIVTMTNVNTSELTLAVRFNSDYWDTTTVRPDWTLTVNVRTRAVTGEGNYTAYSTIHNQMYSGFTETESGVGTSSSISINYVGNTTPAAITLGGDVQVKYTVTHNAGSHTSGWLTSASASQTVEGGGQAGAATLLNGEEGSYYLNYNNFSNKPAAALPLTGGSLTGAIQTTKSILADDPATTSDWNANWRSGFYEGENAANAPSTGWYWGLKSGHRNNHTGSRYGLDLVIQNGGGSSAYIRNTPSNGVGTWQKLWTDFNDGAGSGLNSDMVDGLHASSFVRSDVDDTKTGKLWLNGQITGSSAALQVNGFTRMGSIYLHEGASPSGENKLLDNSGGNLRWDTNTVYHDGNSVDPRTFGVGTSTTPTLTDFTISNPAGLYRCLLSTATGGPDTVGYNAAVVVQKGINGSGDTFLVTRSTGTASAQKMWFGSRTAATGAVIWKEVWHGGNLVNPTVHGLGTLSNTEYPKTSIDDATCPSGFYRVINTNPSTGTRPTGFSLYGYIQVQSYDVSNKLQIYTDINGLVATRVLKPAGHTPWKVKLNVGDTIDATTVNSYSLSKDNGNATLLYSVTVVVTSTRGFYVLVMGTKVL